MTMSIADLQAAGITFDADEAIAITQQLIHGICERPPAELTPPFGPPAPDNVLLNGDGTVVCTGCAATPAVFEVGVFLEALLPSGSPRVPGALRYTMARALLSVDVPPFQSLDEFSRDLARHEHGRRADLVRAVLARAAVGGLARPSSFVERRRSRASATALRRELRAADVRLYEQQAREAAQLPSAPPARGRTLTAAVACLAAGLMLVVAGEYMHRHRAAAMEPQAAAIAPAAPIPAAPAALAQVDAPRIVPVSAPSQARRVTGTSGVRPDGRRIATRRGAHAAASATPRRAAPKPQQRGVLDRLRLGWLRNAFSAHSEL